MSKYKTKEENRRFLKAALFAHSEDELRLSLLIHKVLSCNKCAREESRINFKSVPLSVRQHSSRRGYTILRNMKNKIIGRIVQFISKLF